MQPFLYHRASTFDEAQRAFAIGAPSAARTQFVAGGTTLLDLMKLDVMRPAAVVDINDLQDLASIEKTSSGVRLGALARMSDAAEHPLIAGRYPMVAQSLLLAASPQIRNMASLGGNVLQRTRCAYFRDVAWSACNKRNPGSGCAAIEGINRRHALLGASDDCIASYPGDFAQALIALDATIDVMRGLERRTMPFSDLHTKPGSRPDIETTLAPGEIITAITLPAIEWAWRSRYVKIRDRQSYEFALASAAVALDLDEAHRVREARIALGGVATVPWRARDAEATLKGKPLDEDAAEAAGKAAFDAARPLEHNRFKIALGRSVVARALLETAALER
jgi:xanthine dehydrogenase YagS FAD-binding subunit